MSRLRFPLKQHLRDPGSDDEETLDRMWRRIERRVNRRDRRRHGPTILAWTTAGVAVLAALLLAFRRDAGPLQLADGHPIVNVAAAPGAGKRLSLSDGSEIHLGPGARLTPLETSGTIFAAALTSGSAAFEVRPGGPRRWAIECGLATVEVIGTRFACERSPGRLRVTVERGVVLVRSDRLADRVQRLVAGDALELVDAREQAAPQPPPVAPEPANVAPPPPVAPSAVRSSRAPRGRAFAAEADPLAPAVAPVAPPALAPVAAPQPATPVAPPTPTVVEDTGAARGPVPPSERAAVAPEAVSPEGRRAGIKDLMALADAARLSGHPAAAVEPLERIVGEFADEPQAPLAAFALGRLELDSLRRPARAAAAFERALALGISSSLREDVMARLVEARVRMGDRDGARAAAAMYAREFPQGRHAREVEARLAAP